MRKILSMAILGVSMISISHANEANKEILMQKGVYYDHSTNLYWDRCLLGESWNGETCTGRAVALNWQDAKEYIQKFSNNNSKAGFSDWRLPTIVELSSIRNCEFGEWVKENTRESVLTSEGRKNLTQIDMKSIPDGQGNNVKVPLKCTNDYGGGFGTFAMNKTEVLSRTMDKDLWSLTVQGGQVWFIGRSNYKNQEALLNDPNRRMYVRAVRSDSKLNVIDEPTNLTPQKTEKQLLDERFNRAFDEYQPIRRKL